MISNLKYMQGVKSLQDIDVSNKRVLIRVDFNVPVDSTGNITDDRRIRAALQTINYCMDNKASSIILVSHFGRPKGEYNEKYTLKHIHRRVERLLHKKIIFIEDFLESKKEIYNYEEETVFLLENIRFYDGEEKNDTDFSKKLASICDVFVNDAFGTSHRKHASTYGIADHVQTKVAGFLMMQEIKAFSKALQSPVHPIALVIGGAKISSKITLLKQVLQKIDKLIIGGAMSNTFLKAQGYDIKDSFYEEEYIDTALEVMNLAKKNDVNIYLPVDVVITNEIENPIVIKVVPAQDILEGFKSVDIGPATVKLFSEAVGLSNTIIWNGPMGIFEIDKFSNGTFKIANAIADSYAYTIVGGGDTADAVEKAGETDNFSFISTGGGASLELLEGKILPAFSNLDRKEEVI